jgi:acetyl esterase/lipase
MPDCTQLASKLPWRLGCAVVILACAAGAPRLSGDEFSERDASSTSGNVEGLIGAPIPAAPPGYESVSEFASEIASKKLGLVDGKSLSRGVHVVREVEFSRPAGVPLHLDLYMPRQAKGRMPGLILLHSGGWRDGTRQDYQSYASAFADQGYVAATVDYRLAPRDPFPAALQDVKHAIRWMRRNADKYQIDPARLGIIGSSAGGHLALLAAYTAGNRDLEKNSDSIDPTSDEVQAVVEIYGPTDLTVDPATVPPMVARCVTDFLGASAFVAPDLCRKASPLTYVSAAAPPTLIIHGTLDDIVPISQADALARRLAELRVPYVYDRIDGWPHAMDLTIPIHQRCVWLSERFLERAFELSHHSEQTHP